MRQNLRQEAGIGQQSSRRASYARPKPKSNLIGRPRDASDTIVTSTRPTVASRTACSWLCLPRHARMSLQQPMCRCAGIHVCACVARVRTKTSEPDDAALIELASAVLTHSSLKWQLRTACIMGLNDAGDWQAHQRSRLDVRETTRAPSTVMCLWRSALPSVWLLLCTLTANI